MAKFVDVPNFFSKVYIVDLSPSLCSVARDRFKRLGWKNVVVICENARNFRLDNEEKDRQAHIITMSYSLSMIPDYYSVIDALSSRVTDNGIIGVADFYVQSEVDYQSRNYIGGEINRHCMWISRVFWRAWFEADRVGLEAARRVSNRCSLFESFRKTDTFCRTIWNIALGRSLTSTPALT